MDIELIKKDVMEIKEKIEKYGERAVIIPGETPDEPLFLFETKKIIEYCEFLIREVEVFRRFLVLETDLGVDPSIFHRIIRCPACKRFQTR